MKKFFNVFPNVRTEAYYEPMSQTIVLEYIKRQHLNSVFEKPYNLDLLRHSKTVVHEICHFIDHIGTLKGQKLLLDIFNAYNSLGKNSEKEFWRLARLHDTLRKQKIEGYYKVIEEKVNDSKNVNDWSFSSTVGCRYNKDGKLDYGKPIIFNRFSYKNSNVARMPLSVEALWEINAMASEVEIHMRAITLLKDEGSRLVEVNQLQSDSLEWIYNSELLVYSSATHLVSKHLTFGDIYVSFKLSKVISTISLNLPDRYYSLIKKPIFLSSFIDKKRFKGFINEKDPAFLFLCIIFNIKESGKKYSTVREIDIDEILNLCNLPCQKNLLSEIAREMKLMKRDLISADFDSKYKYLNKKGIDVFNKRGISGDDSTSDNLLSYVNDVEIICEDEIFSSSWYDEVELLKDRIYKFIQACGY